MSVTLANFLFEAANFLVLAAALAWLLFKPVRQALDAERARYSEAEHSAQQLREEATRLHEEARSAQAKLAAELELQRAQLAVEASAAAAKHEEELRRAEDAHRARLAHDSKAAIRDQAEALADVLGSVAAGAVQRMLAQLDGPSLDDALIRRLCAELRRLSPPRAGAIVETAHALSETSRAQLRDVLGAFSEREVPSLVAGARVTTSAGQIDASAVAMARLAWREVSRVAGAEREVEA